MPALLGGLFIGVLSALPIVNCCCCLWIAGGGFLSAYLQSAEASRPRLTILDGARVGLLAGIVGAVVWLLVSTALTPLQLRFVEMARSAGDMPPEVQDFLQSVEAGGFGGNILGFVVFLCVGSIISAIGGMTGAAYFKKDVPPALGGPINPPPLP